MLAIEADRTILIDGDEAIEFANRKGLIVTSLDAPPEVMLAGSSRAG